MLALFLMLACAGSPATPPVPPASPLPLAPGDAANSAAIRVHMAEHLAHATQTRDAVVQGQFDDAQAGFQWLAQHEVEAELPPEWRGWLDELRASAQAGAKATTVADQAMALGQVANSCGGCHQYMDKGPILPVSAAPAGSEGVPLHMARHAWVNDRMWAALVQPDGELWTSSLRVLGPEAVSAAELEDWGQLEGAPEQGHAVHRLAHAALADDNPDTRADLYGQIVGECASCHRTSRGE